MVDFNEIPENWSVVKIGDIFITQSGGTPSTMKKEYWDGNIPWINSGELKDSIITSPSKFITQLGLENSSARLFPKNTVVIALTGATTGKIGLLNIETSTNQSVTGIFPNKNYNYKFVFYQLIFLRSHILKNALGTAQPHINKRIVDDIEITTPPLLEQHRIVEKIEELFTDLDKGIEYLKVAQQQLKVYRQAVLKWAFEGRLTSQNIVDGELPKGWENVEIFKLLLHSKKGMTTGPFGTALKKNEHKKIGVPVLGIENIGEGRFLMPNKIFVSESKAQELKSFEVITDDIIISRSGTVGEICSVPEKMNHALISTNLIRVRLNKEVINTKYFVYLFQGGAVRKQVRQLCKGSTRAFLNQTILSSINFPICDIKEQKLVVCEIESRMSVCDKIEETIYDSLQQAKALRYSILKRAFEGKLVTQDPNDEPAQKLLERINEEKNNR